MNTNKKPNQFKHLNPKFEYKEDGEFSIFSAWVGHEYFVYDLIRNKKPKMVVELGTHNGFSFFAMCQAVKDAKLKTKLFAIDSWEGDKHAGYYKNEVYKKVAKTQKAYYGKIEAYLVKKYFREALKEFKDGSIDILHIDGLHTYRAVKGDFKSWLPKMDKNGIVLFHDISEKSPGFGVYKLWEELKKVYPTIEFIYSHGLGVLFLNKTDYQKISEGINREYVELCMKEAQLYFDQVRNEKIRLEYAVRDRDKWSAHLEKDIKSLNQIIVNLEKRDLVYLIKKIWAKK